MGLRATEVPFPGSGAHTTSQSMATEGVLAGGKAVEA